MSEGSKDTEIILGTGKILGLFFGIVTICALFFGMGYSFGKNSVTSAAGSPAAATAATSAARPSATAKPNTTAPASDLTFYKAVEQKDANTQMPATAPPANTAENAAAATDPTAAQAPSGFFVQVAAVSKMEDAVSLVDALKQKQYPAFSANTSTDKLFHVQVGPFNDIKDAEATRAKLVADGYNPILKK